MSLVSYAASDDSGSESDETGRTEVTNVSSSQKEDAESSNKKLQEIEDSIKTSKMRLSLPDPNANSKKKDAKEKIKIPMFSFKFRKLDSDDEDEDSSKAAKKGPSKQGSGLMALLPTPKNSISLGGGASSKVFQSQTNRVLVPYTLTKQKEEKKKEQKIIQPAAVVKNKTRLVESDGSDDDDDDGQTESGFFTFHKDIVADTTDNVNVATPRDDESVPQVSKGTSTTAMLTSLSEHLPSAEAVVEASSVTGPYLSQDAPQYYSANDAAYEQHVQDSSHFHQGYENTPQDQLQLDEESLRRLQGRRKRKEEINIIDVNGADQQSSASDYLKNITEQTGYSSKRAKAELPSLTKRKHQITYLALQAKEREFELQNEWSSSRQTKRQTQQKYGF